MPIMSISANLSCSRLEDSIPWYTALFGRAPDRRPMEGLAEWIIHEGAEVQLFESEPNAGHGTLTIGVSGLEAERARLLDTGLAPGEIEEADEFYIVRMRDPDGNLVVLASAKRS